MLWSDSLKALEHHAVGKHLTHLKTLESAVSTSWKVAWDADDIAQDLLQNFFDANRARPSAITVSVEHSTVTIAAPKAFQLEQLFYLGSEHDVEDTGHSGAGFKVAVLCLIRDHHIAPIAVSKNQVLYMRTADTEVAEAARQPIVYDFFQSADEYPGTQLILRGCSEKLGRAFATGMAHFFYEGNPLVGARIWVSPKEQFALYASTTAHGHIFYQRRKRGEIPRIPVILVINREYAAIEMLTRQERDRQAFGEKLMGTFYKVFVQSGVQNNHEVQRALVEAARPCWGQEHPLLYTLAKTVSGYHACGRGWPKTTTAEVFGDGYFARVTSHHPARRLEYERLENAWKSDGKVGLPAYFRYFGVLNAETYCWELEQKAHEEAKKKAHRTPSPAEKVSITLLAGCLRGLAPALMELSDQGRTTYSVAETESVLSQLKHDRGYLSREVYLSAQMFAADFPKALTLFLHEHAHIFGEASSRSFPEVLLELLESVVRDRTHLDFYATKWQETRANVLTERAKTTHCAAVLTTKTEEELRTLVLKLPPAVLQALLEAEES